MFVPQWQQFQTDNDSYLFRQGAGKNKKWIRDYGKNQAPRISFIKRTLALLLTWQRSTILAPGRHIPTKPVRARLAILDASWYLVHTSLFSLSYIIRIPGIHITILQVKTKKCGELSDGMDRYLWVTRWYEKASVLISKILDCSCTSARTSATCTT